MRLSSLLLLVCVASGAAHANITPPIKSLDCARVYNHGESVNQHMTLTLTKDKGQGYTLTANGQKFHVFGLVPGHYEDNPDYQTGSEGMKGRFWFDAEHTIAGKVFYEETPDMPGGDGRYYTARFLRVEVPDTWLDLDGHSCKAKYLK